MVYGVCGLHVFVCVCCGYRVMLYGFVVLCFVCLVNMCAWFVCDVLYDVVWCVVCSVCVFCLRVFCLAVFVCCVCALLCDVE